MARQQSNQKKKKARLILLPSSARHSPTNLTLAVIGEPSCHALPQYIIQTDNSQKLAKKQNKQINDREVSFNISHVDRLCGGSCRILLCYAFSRGFYVPGTVGHYTSRGTSSFQQDDRSVENTDRQVNNSSPPQQITQ